MNCDVYFRVLETPQMAQNQRREFIRDYTTGNAVGGVGKGQAGKRLWRVNMEESRISEAETALTAAGFVPEILAACYADGSLVGGHPANQTKYENHFDQDGVDGEGNPVWPARNVTAGYAEPIFP